MTIFITAVQMQPTNASEHQHIAWVRWVRPGVSNTTVSSREQMVEWINNGGDARVRDGQGSVQVGVVKADPPYLRTYADGRPSDNLLSLPRF